MRINKKLTLLALTGVVALTGCATTTEQAEPFTDEEVVTYLDEYTTLINEEVEPSVFMEKMSEGIGRLPEDEASNLVDSFLYLLYTYPQEMNETLSGMQKALQEAMEDGVDINSKDALTAIEDETVQTFLKQVQERKMYIHSINNELVIQPDLAFLLDTYGDYMVDELKALTEFNLTEAKTSFFDASANQFDLDIVAERIAHLESLKESFDDEFYLKALESSANYYYQIYFGTNNDFLVDEDDVLLPPVKEHYVTSAEDYAGTTFGDRLNDVLALLEKTDDTVTEDVYVELLDITGANTKTITEEDVTDDAVTEDTDEANTDEADEKTSEETEAETEEDEETASLTRAVEDAQEENETNE